MMATAEQQADARKNPKVSERKEMQLEEKVLETRAEREIKGRYLVGMIKCK